MTKNGQNDPKMAKNYPKWPKITQNGQKLPKMDWNVWANGPNETRNTNTKLADLKLPKNGQNYPKMAKNGHKNGRFFFHLETHIIFRKPILTQNFSSLGLQIAEKIEKIKSDWDFKKSGHLWFSRLFEGQMSWNLVSK